MALFGQTNKRLLQDRSIAHLMSFPALLVAPKPPGHSANGPGSVEKNMSDKKRVLGKWKYSLLLLLANVVYIYIGTLVFIYIEAGPYAQESALHWETKLHYIDHLKDPDRVLPELLTLQKKMCRKNNDVAKSWHFTGSLTYCLSILSTVGYGVMRPHDALSRGVTMLYAVIGLPIYALYLNYANTALTKFISRLAKLVFWCCRGRKRMGKKGGVSEQKSLNGKVKTRNTVSGNGEVGPEEDLVGNVCEYKRLSSEGDVAGEIREDNQEKEDHVTRKRADLERKPVLVTENTVETLLSSGSGNSIEKLCEALPSEITSEESRECRTDSGTSKTSNISYLLLTLLLSILLLSSYVVILLIWCPILPDETIVDEIYWLMIRFTTIGFGDEFRDITRSPAHLPGVLNSFIVSLVVLPLGIALASHIFYVYRKLGADRLRRANTARLSLSAKRNRACVRITCECECVSAD